MTETPETLKIGSKEYLEKVLRKKMAGEECKLPAILVYLHAHAKTDLYGHAVSRRDLEPFLKAPNRRKFLDALDKKRGGKVFCIELEFSEEQGRPITCARLLQEDVRSALQAVERAFSLEWRQVVGFAGCTEEDMAGIGSAAPRSTARPIAEARPLPASPVRPTYRQASSGIAQPSPMSVVPLQTELGEEEKHANLQRVLNELHRIAVDNVVLGTQLGGQKTLPRKRLIELSDRGCVQLVFSSGGRGWPGIVTVRLLKRDVPKREEKTAEARVAPPSPAAFRVPDGYALVRREELSSLRVAADKAKNGTRRESATLVFVDTGNLTGKRYQVGGDDRRFFGIANLNWRSLMWHIKRGPGGGGIPVISDAFAYIYVELEANPSMLHARQSGFTVVTHHKKDTDNPMSGDIGALGRHMMSSCKRLTVVIVSGDSDFYHVAKQLKSMAAQTDTELSVWVVGWKDNIHRHMRLLANTVSHLDDMTDLFFIRNSRRAVV